MNTEQKRENIFTYSHPLLEQAPLMNFCEPLLKFDYAVLIVKFQGCPSGCTWEDFRRIINFISHPFIDL